MIAELGWINNETKGPKWFYSEAVFTKDCFEVAVEKMFVDVPSLLINLPCDADIGQEIERGYLCADITCATRTVNDITVSSKRHLSKGEKMGIQKRTKIQKKSQCSMCYAFYRTTDFFSYLLCF